MARNPSKSMNRPVTREVVTVMVDGIAEEWRLEWEQAPTPVCDADDPGWNTCPCSGFAFGEQGKLRLVRRRGHQEVERLALTPLFKTDFDDLGSRAVVSRWEPLPGDMDQMEDEQFTERVRRRPVKKVINLADYNHDGKATEFVLQVATLPCGKRIGALIGVSKAAKKLHAFSTVEHPEQPLLLRLDHWDALLKAKGQLRRVDWPCGDHGAETQTELELMVDAKGFHVKESEYQCPDNGQQGKLLETTVR